MRYAMDERRVTDGQSLSARSSVVLYKVRNLVGSSVFVLGHESGYVPSAVMPSTGPWHCGRREA